MSETLKSCPFCGSMPVVSGKGTLTNCEIVSCPTCHASSSYHRPQGAAIAAWNRRAKPTPEALEAWAEWFDDPNKSPPMAVPLYFQVHPLSNTCTPGYLLREIAWRMRANKEE